MVFQSWILYTKLLFGTSVRFILGLAEEVFSQKIYKRWSSTVFDGNGTTLTGGSIGGDTVPRHDFSGVRFNCARLKGIARKEGDDFVLYGVDIDRELVVDGKLSDLPYNPVLIFDECCM